MCKYLFYTQLVIINTYKKAFVRLLSCKFAFVIQNLNLDFNPFLIYKFETAN